MSGRSSSVAGWFTLLEPTPPETDLKRRPDDPRLDEVLENWRGELDALRPGRTVLVGFPQDEGVRRNLGRPGAAEAPLHIRHWLRRLSPWDGQDNVSLVDDPPLDAGNVRILGSLEESQQALAEVIGGILLKGAVPVVLGGGHETAYGHYLGYLASQRSPGIINVDAHLDVRPCKEGEGHSGSPFRQALEHPTHPLSGAHYVCLGAQPHAVSQQHLRFARERGCVVRWAEEVRHSLPRHFLQERDRLAMAGCAVHVTIDADSVQLAEVPGVSAPNVLGLDGREVIACTRLAGQSPQVASLDLVEINPRHDPDGRSSRWAALAVWHFLIGRALIQRGLPRLSNFP